jgi:hypothetical protein
MSWWLRWSEHSVTLDGHTVGLFDGAETGGNACLAGGDGPAVAVAVGVFGERLAVALDLTDVSFTFVGVSGDGEHNNISRGGVQDESDGLGFGVATGQGYRRGLVIFRPRPFEVRSAVPGAVVEVFEQGVGAVDLVTGGGEVLTDRADIGAASGAVLHEASGFGLVGIGAGAGVDAQLGLELMTDRAGFDEADQALGEDR